MGVPQSRSRWGTRKSYKWGDRNRSLEPGKVLKKKGSQRRDGTGVRERVRGAEVSGPERLGRVEGDPTQEDLG